MEKGDAAIAAFLTMGIAFIGWHIVWFFIRLYQDTPEFFFTVLGLGAAYLILYGIFRTGVANNVWGGK